MKRLIDYHLKSWKENLRRKPLLLRGARQVGKTHSIRQLGKTFSAIVEINFELLPQAKSIFEKDLMPERIIWELGLLTKTTIVPGKTLLFLDEVQEAPKVILALRYFYEQMPDLHVIAAGSLIDFAINQVGVPVGRVSMLYVYPLSFLEFLAGSGHSLYITQILQNESYSEIIHDNLMELLAKYLVIGGMPEVVSAWTKTNNPKICREIQNELIETYIQDFPKYTKKHQIKYVDTLFNQIPHFIGEQFKYSSIHGEYKKRELAPSLDLLCHANVVHKITHSAGNGIPLGAEINLDWFKMIFLDVGLTQAMLGVDLASWFLNRDKNLINRGTIVEAFVGQEILCYESPKNKNDLYFWKREAKGSLAEVDYLLAQENSVVPVEVKSGLGSTLRSMQQFLESHKKSTYGLRFWAENTSEYQNILSKPLYSVARMAHPDQKEAIESLLE